MEVGACWKLDICHFQQGVNLISPVAADAEGWWPGGSARPACVHHHQGAAAAPRRLHHPRTHQVLPQGPDQAGQVSCDWSTPDNTHLWLVDTWQYSPLIGRHLTILTSDWSSAGSPPASTSSSSHKKPLLHLLPSPLYLIFILQYPTTINYVPDSAHLFQINWMIAINCHSRSHFYIHNARIVNNCQLNEALWLWSSRAIKVRCLIWECEFKSGIFNRIYLL